MKREDTVNSLRTNCVISVISNGKEENRLDRQEKLENENEGVGKPADFESAIKATEFGRFNALLFLLAIPSLFSTMFSSTTMAYILPISQCDLDLTLQNKGMLNAISYIGMISSAFIWGYLADTIGRKKLLVFGYLLDWLFVVLCGLSQHYSMLIAFKFMTGFIINGPFAALMSYANEFHCAKYRTLIPFISGGICSIAAVVMPVLGWLLFSDSINLSLLNGSIVLRSWNVFILVCSLPSLTAGLGYLALPESPKFLMTMGQNDKALETFQKVYSYNTGNPPNMYPIKVLLDETKQPKDDKHACEGHVKSSRTKIGAIKEGWRQILPLFYPPYLGKIVIVFSIQFTVMMGFHTLRLWLPQLFAVMNDYLTFHPDDEDADICKMLEIINLNITEISQGCLVNFSNDSVYKSNIVSAALSMIPFAAAATVTNIIGKRSILILSAVTSAVCAFCMYFARNETTVVSLMAVYNGLLGVSSNVVVSIAVDIFPTTLRTMTVSLTMMFGRTGAMLGNLIFPALLGAGCVFPFLTIGSLVLGGALLAALLPKTDLKPLD